MTNSADGVLTAKYVLLTTFRRDGTAVPTAVWAVADGDAAVLIWTSRKTGKVTRIRRSGRVTAAPCTMSGRPTGPAIEGFAELLDAEGTLRVQQAIVRKYGLIGRMIVGRAVRRAGQEALVGIRVRLAT